MKYNYIQSIKLLMQQEHALFQNHNVRHTSLKGCSGGQVFDSSLSFCFTCPTPHSHPQIKICCVFSNHPYPCKQTLQLIRCGSKHGSLINDKLNLFARCRHPQKSASGTLKKTTPFKAAPIADNIASSESIKYFRYLTLSFKCFLTQALNWEFEQLALLSGMIFLTSQNRDGH